MEAHEALVSGVLGVATLYAFHRKRDPVDRSLAVVLLWVCLTGVLGLLLAQLTADFWRYLRLALRLTGPVLLLVVAEESVRTAGHGGSRRNSVLFAGVLWALAVGGFVYRGGRSLAELDLSSLGRNVQMGVTSWMALVTICAVGALMSVAPAMARRIRPGFAGLAALALLASETWAAYDPRWGMGSAGPLTYRTLLTLGLAGVAVLKARSEGWSWAMTARSDEATASPPAAEGAPPAKAEEERPAGGRKSSSGRSRKRRK